MANYMTPIFISLILLLQPWAATATDFNLAPYFSPIFDDVCKEVECGKGSCIPSTKSNSSFMFHCECESGWKQPLSDDHDKAFKFLPCIIPNCTLDYSCANTTAPAPVQEKEKQTNTSLFDPCRWADCGGGTCNKTSQFSYTCLCDENYYNLLNSTYLPCLRECALGMDCTNLGISVMNPSAASSLSTNLSDNSSSQASVMLVGGVFKWSALMIMLLALVT